MFSAVFPLGCFERKSSFSLPCAVATGAVHLPPRHTLAHCLENTSQMFPLTEGVGEVGAFGDEITALAFFSTDEVHRFLFL